MNKEELLSKANVIYHNLHLARHSVNELNYLLNHPADSFIFLFVGFPFYLTDLVDIHNRNVIIMLYSSLRGDLSISKLINQCEQNLDNVEFLYPRIEMLELFNKSRNIIRDQEEKHLPLLKASRDQFAGHQDSINAGPIKDIGNIVFRLEDMFDLLPNLEQAFDYIYYSLVGKHYERIPDKSFIKESLYSLYDKKIQQFSEMSTKKCQ